jgi:hypothetical protein
MGTSGTTSGSGSGTPLVPTWLDEPGSDPLPCNDPNSDGVPGDDQSIPNDDQSDKPKPLISPPPQPERFRSARTNFSKFANSGGKDQQALKRAVRDYVRKGTNGGAGAVRRMGPSRTAASNALGVFRGIQRDGVTETLRRLNLQNFEGQGVQQVFVGLTEVICQDGGSVDEAIARDAWLETIADLGKFGIDDLDSLSSDQIQEVFLSFIAHTVEARLYQEIGVNGFTFAEDMGDIDGFDSQFRDYIERTVADSFTGDFVQISQLSDHDIREVVDKTYLEAWNLLELIGDREG